MAKYLVTGGAGFIGSHLVDKLIALGNEVVIIDDLSTGKEEYLNSKAKFYNICVSSDKIADIFAEEKFDYVFHLAAQMSVHKSVEDPHFDNKINVVGSLNIFKGSAENKVKKIIFMSTGGAIYSDVSEPAHEKTIPKPDSPYATHKFAAERHLELYSKLYDLKYAILRPANIYGPRQYKGGEGAVIAVFTNNILEDKDSYIFGSGKQSRDFLYVDDLIDACLMVIERGDNDFYNVSTEKDINLFDIINTIEKVTGKTFKYSHKDALPGEAFRSILTSKKIKEHLGWEPKTDFEEGIRRTIEWLEGRKS